MMAFVFLILKIIGFLLLGILGLFLVLILTVLFVPVRYWAKGSYYGEWKGKAGVSWLLHILSVRVSYEETLDITIRVFGIPIGERAVKEKKRKAESEPKPQSQADISEAEKEPEKKVMEDPVDLHQAQTQPTDPLEWEAGKATSEKRKTGKRNAFSIRKICDKLKLWMEKKDQILEQLQQEENKKTFRLLLRQAKRLLRHILPVKAAGKIRFGFDDPYTTGQVLQYLSPFYSVYQKHFQVIPVFEEAVLEGELNIKGRIRAGTLLWIGIRVLFDKNVRLLIKKARS